MRAGRSPKFTAFMVSFDSQSWWGAAPFFTLENNKWNNNNIDLTNTLCWNRTKKIKPKTKYFLKLFFTIFSLYDMHSTFHSAFFSLPDIIFLHICHTKAFKIKLMFILDKDNPIVKLMVLFIDNPNVPVPVWKSHCSLLLSTFMERWVQSHPGLIPGWHQTGNGYKAN